MKPAATNSRIGRPTPEESVRRHEELLERAMEVFIDRGFEKTTVLDIASTVGMSKGTIYSHYAGKDELFLAAFRRTIERFTLPIETYQAVEVDDLETTLKAVARLRIDNVSTPTGIKFQRILYAESIRFPGLYTEYFEVGSGPCVAFLSDLFIRRTKQGELNVDNPENAAVSFIILVVGGLTRFITTGGRPGKDEIEKRINYTIRLLLDCMRPR